MDGVRFALGARAESLQEAELTSVKSETVDAAVWLETQLSDLEPEIVAGANIHLTAIGKLQLEGPLSLV